MDIESERERLSQSRLLLRFRSQIRLTEMVTVYWSESDNQHNYAIYCPLIPTSRIEESFANPTWDATYGSGSPGTVQYYTEGEEKVQYLRFGNDDGIEPLVIGRYFNGIRPGYAELSEEFRLFHNLYHDRKEDHYIKIDDDGNEHLVAIVEANRIQVRLKEIRQFLAIKEMHLAIQFDCREYSGWQLNELGLTTGGNDSRDDLLCWSLYYGGLDGIGSNRAFSRLLGKRLIAPLPREKSGFWAFACEEPKKHEDFIIGIDEHGDEITHTSDPLHLADHFGGNPGAPHYLTPVHFRKQVLDKYYQEPMKYSVEDNILRCASLWLMAIDNHHEDQVCAWLGDLGRDLPYQEQLHWRSYNIPPTGSMSETFIRRQLLCQCTASNRPEHEFSRLYERLSTACDESIGWRLLLPLTDEDLHCLQVIRVPSSDEQKDFDDLVLALTKILVDSLNEEKLKELLPKEGRDSIKGSISRLEKVCETRAVKGHEDHIRFLRRLQSLRSEGTAHRKGSNYRRTTKELGIDSLSLRTVFQDLLVKAVDLLQFLEAVARSGALKRDTSPAGQ